MNKAEALQLKGIAILMMLFLHLFNTTERVGLCETYINFWNGKPLVFAMSRIAAFCVPIYLFISGYGLTQSYQQKGIRHMHPFQRIAKLYIVFWVVFLLFIPLGHFLNPDLYRVDPNTLITNFFAIDYSYNHEWWFLFPYFLLVLSFRLFISLISRFTPKQNSFFFILLCLLHIAHGPLLAHIPDFSGKQILTGYLTTLTPFVTGIFFSHYNLFHYFTLRLSLSHSKYKNAVLLFLLILLLLLRMMLGPSILNPLFIVPFIILFLLLKRPPILCRILQYFGRHSTHIWLTHTFFAYYLFSDLIYGLRYPALIYTVLLVVSLLSSYLIGFIHSLLTRAFHLLISPQA